MPKISVIVPVYNVEQYLTRCVESILNQTFADFELILVDDGSPDNCGAICDEYKNKDDRIRVFHLKNGGVSRARNYGVNQAKGEFVTFIDSDDYVHPDFLKIHYECLEKSGSDICVTCMQKVFDNNDEEPLITLDFETMSNREAINRYGKCPDSRFRAPFAKVIRTTIAKKNPFPEGRRFAEDLATNYRYYNDAKLIANNESVLYFYYFNTESTVNQKYQLWRLGNLDTLEELLTFCKNNDYPGLYNHYAKEYARDLFYQYCNIKEYYENNRTADELLNKMVHFLKLPEDQRLKDIKNIYELTDYFYSIHRNDLFSMYMLSYMYSLYLDCLEAKHFKGKNIESKKKELKTLIKSNKKRLNITPRTYPEWFEYIYPVKMYIYWTIKGILNKFVKK